MSAEKQDAIAQFFSRYPADVGAMAVSLRKVIRAAIPRATETLDESGGVVGYGIGAGYSGLVCTIIPSKTGVKLGIVRGAELPDPEGLLEGTESGTVMCSSSGTRTSIAAASRISSKRRKGSRGRGSLTFTQRSHVSFNA